MKEITTNKVFLLVQGGADCDAADVLAYKVARTKLHILVASQGLDTEKREYNIDDFYDRNVRMCNLCGLKDESSGLGMHTYEDDKIILTESYATAYKEKYADFKNQLLVANNII